MERHLKAKRGGGQRTWVEGGTAQGRRMAVRAAVRATVCPLWSKARRLEVGNVGYGVGLLLPWTQEERLHFPPFRYYYSAMIISHLLLTRVHLHMWRPRTVCPSKRRCMKWSMTRDYANSHFRISSYAWLPNTDLFPLVFRDQRVSPSWLPSWSPSPHLF